MSEEKDLQCWHILCYCITENPLPNNVTPPTSTRTISEDCTEQESIPDASTSINQKPRPKQDESNLAIVAEKATTDCSLKKIERT